MPRPEDDNEFGLRDVRIPVQRAHEVEKRHEAHGFFEKAWSFTKGAAYASVALNPLTMPAVLALDPRFRRVSLAVSRSLLIAPGMMLDESIGVGKRLLQGIVPMLGELAKWAGGGALVGGAIGAVGGLGVLDEATIPGGILFGFEAGLAIGGFWALKDLLIEAAKHLHTFINYAIDATELAWYAGDDRTVSEDQDINSAAKLFAVAISELWWVILQALIMWVFKRAAGIAGEMGGAAIEGTALAKALAEATEKSAKFGKPFNDWFRDNFDKIKDAAARRNRAIKELSEPADSGGKPTVSNGSTPSSNTAAQVKPKKPKSLREQYLGRTPGKSSRTGLEVQDRMRADGDLMDGPDGTIFRDSKGEWRPLEDADMAHNTDAVKWWNAEGRQYGAKSPEVRDWMLDSDNYTLDYYGLNRSAGAQLPDRYLPPLK